MPPARTSPRNRLDPPGPGGALACLLGLLCLLASGCAGRVERAPYPHESLLTVIAELRLFLARDPYLMPPGDDLEGRNIFRVSLQRVEALQNITGPEYADVLAFARGECLERLGDWPSAAAAFRQAAQTSSTLSAEAAGRATHAARMAELTDRSRFTQTLDGYLNDLDVLERRLGEWRAENPPYPYSGYVRCEAERALGERVRLLFNNRMVIADAAPRAIELADRLAQDFKDGRRASEHLLQVGYLYETLARDLTAQTPPEGLDFNPEAGWQGWIDQARGAYTRVAQSDGDPAKPEAQARLRALDAYALRVLNAAR